MWDSLSAKQKEQKTTESKFNCFPSLKVLRNSCVESHFSRVWFFSTPMDCSPPGSSVHGILQSRLLEWLPCPPPGDLPNLGTEPISPVATALQSDSLLLNHQGSPKYILVSQSGIQKKQNMRIVSYILFAAIQEDCSMGDSISDGSEELLKVRGNRYICDFGEGGHLQSNTHFVRGSLLGTRGRCLQ